MIHGGLILMSGDKRDMMVFNKRLAPILFVIDTSASMEGESIAAVNEGMRKLIEKMVASEASFFADNDIGVGILSFSSSAIWRTHGLEMLDDFSWSDLYVEGLSNFGEALRELNNKLSRRELFNHVGGCRVPTIFFILEGSSSDEYKDTLHKLRNNRWFQISQKICVDYNFADNQMVNSLIENNGVVLNVKNPVELRETIENEFFKHLKYWTIGPKKHRDDVESDSTTDEFSLEDGRAFSGFEDDDFW